VAEPTKRGVGRPRTKPADARERKWWATDAEYETVAAAARAAGLSPQEYVRRRALRLPPGAAKK